MSETPRENRLVTPELVEAVKRLPRYARLAWRLARDPRVPPSAKAFLAGGVLYSLSPVDLVPGFIPVVGQLDDLLVLLTTMSQALKSLGPEASGRLMEEAGVTPEDLWADRQAVAAAMRVAAREAWRLGKAGARLTAEGAYQAARVAGRVGRAGAQLALRAGRTALQGMIRSRGRRHLHQSGRPPPPGCRPPHRSSAIQPHCC